MKVTIYEQLEGAQQIAKRRRQEYPALVREGRLRKEIAEFQIAVADAIVATLEKMVMLHEASEEIINAPNNTTADGEQRPESQGDKSSVSEPTIGTEPTVPVRGGNRFTRK